MKRVFWNVFSDLFICFVTSATLSHRVWKLFLCSFVLFFKRKGFYSWIAFKWAKLVKFIRFEARWELELFFITKFTEMWWNDGVFEGSEEHRRCSGKVTNFRLAGVEKLFPWWRDSSLLCASFRMTWFCFLLTIRNLNYFLNAKLFYYSYVFKEAK